MSFPACPSCSFPDVPVADRAIAHAVDLVTVQGEDGLPVTTKTTTISVHRSYRCAGCLETFWTVETVQTVKAKTYKIRRLYEG